MNDAEIVRQVREILAVPEGGCVIHAVLQVATYKKDREVAEREVGRILRALEAASESARGTLDVLCSQVARAPGSE